MAEIVGFVALSHSPFWCESSADGLGEQFAAGVTRARERIVALQPDVVVVFGPDHFRNVFFDLMPAFCIGIGEIVSFGDYGSYKGNIPFPDGVGRHILEDVQAAGFDPAFSLRMGVDHGIAQPYEVLQPDMATPMVPIMLDCAAAPRPTFRRSYDFGRAVGDAVRALPPDLRILVLSSGGLSHWVATPTPEDADVDTREYLIDGRDKVVEYNAAREASVAQRIAAEHKGRVNDIWDRWFLDRLTAGDIGTLLDMDSDDVEAQAGNGAHEVRSWLAGLGAWKGSVEVLAYEPVPRWMTGMGIISGTV